MKVVQLKSKNKNKHNLFLLLSLFFLGCSNVRIKNYYLPQNFTGNVAIVFDGNNKESQSKQEFSYNVPSNGILCVQGAFPAGDFVTNYYQKNDLNGFDTLSVESTLTPAVAENNHIGFPRVLAISSASKKEIIVVAFYVGKEKTKHLSKDREDFERRLEKVLLGANEFCP